MAGGKSQIPSPTPPPPPSSKHINTQRRKIITRNIRGIHLYTDRNKQIKKKDDEWKGGGEGHSSLTLLALGSCLRLTLTHLPKRYAVTSICSLFKERTYELCEKRHIGCRVIWWGHLHVQLLYSHSQKMPCECPQAIKKRYRTEMRRYCGSAPSCLNSNSGLPARLATLDEPASVTCTVARLRTGLQDSRGSTSYKGGFTVWDWFRGPSNQQSNR